MDLRLTVALLASAGIAVLMLKKPSLFSGDARERAEELLARTGKRFSSGDSRTLLERKIVQANLDIRPEVFAGLRIALPLACMALFVPPALFGFLDIYWGVVPALALWFLPGWWLNNRVKSRVAAIRRDLPDFSIMFSTALAAGADILTALEQVASSLKGELGAEVQRACRDMAVGKRRTDALAEMAARCGVDELTALVRVIEQAQRYGSPLAETVKQHAAQMQLLRRYEAQRVAGELGVKIIFPIIMFILFPMLILVGFPVIWHLIAALGN